MSLMDFAKSKSILTGSTCDSVTKSINITAILQYFGEIKMCLAPPYNIQQIIKQHYLLHKSIGYFLKFKKKSYA